MATRASVLAREPPARIGEEEQDEEAPVQTDERPAERAREPGEPRQRHPDTGAARRPTQPRHCTEGKQDEADREVSDRERHAVRRPDRELRDETERAARDDEHDGYERALPTHLGATLRARRARGRPSR